MIECVNVSQFKSNNINVRCQKGSPQTRTMLRIAVHSTVTVLSSAQNRQRHPLECSKVNVSFTRSHQLATILTFMSERSTATRLKLHVWSMISVSPASNFLSPKTMRSNMRYYSRKIKTLFPIISKQPTILIVPDETLTVCDSTTTNRARYCVE